MLDAQFHLRLAGEALERARDRAETPAQHSVFWRLEENARELRSRVRSVSDRLRLLRAGL